MHMHIPLSSSSSSDSDHGGQGHSILRGVLRRRSRSPGSDSKKTTTTISHREGGGDVHPTLITPNKHSHRVVHIPSTSTCPSRSTPPDSPTSTTTTTYSTSSSASVSKAPGDPLAETEGRADTPPDGEEVVAEWKEGRDLVIETRKGPGEDVDVIVIRGGAAGEPGEVEQRIRRLKQKILGKATGGSGAKCTGGRAHQD